jgi:hypothetical protein
VPTNKRQTVGGTDSFTFTFTKPLDRPGVTYQVQQSVDLVNWENVSDQVISTGPNTETRQVTTSQSSATSKLFFRLKVTVAP